MASSNAFPPTKCWMVGFGPNCDVADVNTVGIKGQGAGSEGGDPTEGPGARDFWNCLRQTELRCVEWLNNCVADAMIAYADAMSLQTSRGSKAENAWTEQAHNLGFYNWFDQANTRYISRVNAKSNVFGIVGDPKSNHPNTAFIYHAAARAECMARLKCDFSACYCRRKGCARCEEDGKFVIDRTTGTPGDTDPGEEKLRKDATVSTDPFHATTSDYGGVIPLVYGVGRVKGNLIWAGNARAQTATFVSENDTEVLSETLTYYTVDLAVSVCSGEIGAIGRIWLGDRVIYNGAFQEGGSARNANLDYDPKDIGLSDDKAKLSFPFKVTVYRGTEDQRPHPLLSAAGEFPIGYRDQAYVVFENFALVGAGSLPDMTFEVIQTVDATIAPKDVADLSTIPFDGVDNDILIADRDNNAFMVAGLPKVPLARTSVVKLGGGTLAPINVLYPDVDEIGGETLYSINKRFVHMDPNGNVFFNKEGVTTTYRKTYIFDSGPERTRRVFGQDSTVPPTGDYMRALHDHAAFHTVIDGTGFSTRVGFFGNGNIMEVLRYDIDGSDFEVVQRITFPGPIAALYAHDARLEDEIRKYLYAFYWTGSGTARVLTARVYLLQASTDVQTTGFDPDALRYNDIVVNKSLWAADDTAQIVGVMTDARDNTLVVNMRGTTGYMFKWLDGASPWYVAHAALPTNVAKRTFSSPSLSGRYRWIGAALYTMDLDNGAVVSEPLAFTPTDVGAQYYDNTTDSIVLIDGNGVVRYYANRVRRGLTRLDAVLNDIIRRGGGSVNFGGIATEVLGFVITQQTSVRSVLEQLALLYGLTISGAAEVTVNDNGAGQTVTAVDPSTLFHKPEGAVTIKIIDDAAFVTRVNVQFYDIDQLYDIRSVAFDMASIASGESRPANILAYDFPVVMTEESALQFAERMLFRAHALQRKAEIVVPPASLLEAGDGVLLEGKTYRARTSTYQTGLGTKLELVSDPLGVDRGVPDIGRITDPVPDDDVVTPSGSIDAQVVNVPAIYPAGAVGEPILSSSFLISLTSTPSEAVTIEYGDQFSGRASGSVVLRKAPVTGRLAASVGAITNDQSIDRVNSVVVIYDVAPDQALFDGDAFARFSERLLIVGSELIKFNKVTWSVDGKTATFTELLRGRRNTDMYAGAHSIGETVYLYEDDAFGNAYLPTDYSSMGTTRLITLDSGRLTRSWLGRLRSDVIIPPVMWRDDGFDTLSITDKVVRFAFQARYWNDNVFEDDRGDIIPVPTNLARTLTPRPTWGLLLLFILREPYDDVKFRANFVTSASIYEEFPSNPYIAAVMIGAANPGVNEMQALPRHFALMAVIGPATLSADLSPSGMVAYGSFGDTTIYQRETLEISEIKYPMQGGVIVRIDGYSRPF